MLVHVGRAYGKYVSGISPSCIIFSSFIFLHDAYNGFIGRPCIKIVSSQKSTCIPIQWIKQVTFWLIVTFKDMNGDMSGVRTLSAWKGEWTLIKTRIHIHTLYILFLVVEHNMKCTGWNSIQVRTMVKYIERKHNAHEP
jgi:hypothetical protein